MTSGKAIHGRAGSHGERPVSGKLADLATRTAVNRQRRVWSRRVASWDQHGSANLARVTAAVIAVAAVQPGEVAVDLGAGNGQVTLPLAVHGARVLGVDISPGMAGALRSEARRRGLPTVEAITVPIEELDLPAWQRRPDRVELRTAPPSRPRQGETRAGCGAMADARRPNRDRGHDVRARRHAPGSRDHQAEALDAGTERARGLVADRQERCPVSGPGAGVPDLDGRLDGPPAIRGLYLDHSLRDRGRSRAGLSTDACISVRSGPGE